MAIKTTLTLKQKLFVHEYLLDLNATQAAIRAGYSKKTAYSIGFENLKKPEIAEAIQRASTERVERTKIDADYVLLKAKELFERCMQEIEPVTVNGAPVLDDTGRTVFRFDATGALRALKIIGDHTAVNAFKETSYRYEPIDKNLTMTVVYTSKEEYDRRGKCIEHKPQ